MTALDSTVAGIVEATRRGTLQQAGALADLIPMGRDEVGDWLRQLAADPEMAPRLTREVLGDAS